MPAPVLEFDMLIAMKEYMLEMIKEHKKEINVLVLVRRQFKDANRFAELEDVKKRIDKLQGLENKAHNFILFIKDYLKKLKE
nr:MAG: hypothetical protein [uncultured archaeon]